MESHVSERSEITQLLPSRPVKCPRCGYECLRHDSRCPRCGESLAITLSTVAKEVDEARSTLLLALHRTDRLEEHTPVILQIFPSGQCVTQALQRPLTLGRQTAAGPEDVFDLTDYDAYQLGVSRRHCLLQREDTYLTVMDLGSANGTCLNGKKLPAYRSHRVANGDHLLLGRLHLLISFSPEEPE
jgi:hypothetical protein